MTVKSALAGVFSVALLGTGLAAVPGQAHAAPAKVTVTQLDEDIPVAANEACGFRLVVQLKATQTSYDQGRQHIDIFDGQPSAVVNPANGKKFAFNGDGAFVDYYNKSRTRTQSTGTGAQLYWGESVLPGTKKHKNRMIFTTGKTTFQIRNAKREDGGWFKFQKFSGKRVNVCNALR